MTKKSRSTDRNAGYISDASRTIESNTDVFNRHRYDAIDDLGETKYEQLKDEARQIKEQAIAELPTLLERVEESVSENGGSVYVASDATDARRHIQSICSEVDASTVVKSKSMTSEEIDINGGLEEIGVDAIETDLGEFVLQLAEEHPSHIVAPSIHKSREDIAALFGEVFDLDEPLRSADELTRFARDVLADEIRSAEVGMTGANFVVADTGSIALVTNEGNARKVIEDTNVHIAVAGIEKLLPSLESLQPFIELLARSGTGQSITAYTSILTPPIDSPPVETDDSSPGTRSFHLVLIDNGRWDIRDDPELRETLYCIRCSACLNSCANFQSVGGHAFGGKTYSGGIATGWETAVNGIDSASTFNDFCTGCSRCLNQCPVRIDIPWINTVVRSRLLEGVDPDRYDGLVDGLKPSRIPTRSRIQKRFFSRFESIVKMGSATAPVSNWIGKRRVMRRALEAAIGIDRRRELPTFRRRTFHDLVRARTVKDTEATDRRAVIYPDLYTTYLRPERGIATMDVLEELGVSVSTSPMRSSGRAPFSQGNLERARDHARDVVEELNEFIEDGYDVIVIEPTDLAMFRGEYSRLLSTEEVSSLEANCYDPLEYVYGVLERDGETLERYDKSADPRLIVHRHCQQRTVGVDAYIEAVLERLGYEFETTDVECCGMAGSFGYKAEYYDVSKRVGSRLESQIRRAEATRVVASGTSCVEQIESLIDERPIHPMELIATDCIR